MRNYIKRSQHQEDWEPLLWNKQTKKIKTQKFTICKKKLNDASKFNTVLSWLPLSFPFGGSNIRRWCSIYIKPKINHHRINILSIRVEVLNRVVTCRHWRLTWLAQWRKKKQQALRLGSGSHRSDVVNQLPGNSPLFQLTGEMGWLISTGEQSWLQS